MIAEVVAWLSASGASGWAGSGAVYPVANIVHLLGLVLLIGAIGLIDLVILGALPSLARAPVAPALTPLGVAGLILAATSGLVLFAADAAALVASPVFRWKLLLVAFGLANAAVFRALAPNGLARRLSAGLSLGLWLSVATLGRLIAYS